jgi:hypothetical protein
MFKKTVDSILADVQKKISQLHKLAQTKYADAQDLRNDAAIALSVAEEHEIEAARANRVASKIRELVA